MRVLLFQLILVIASSLIPGADDPWMDLQRQQAVISSIRIEVKDVFDLSNPEENNWVGRTANAVHLRTRSSVIRRTILIEPGDKVNAAVIHETERLLRSLPFILDARIVPGASSAEGVVARVIVQDTWSIKPRLHIESEGGHTDWRIGLREVNLLGYGKQLSISHEKSLERTTEEIAYGDPLLFGTRWTLQTAYRHLSDGVSRWLHLERPFYKVAAMWSFGVDLERTESTITGYNDSREVYAFPLLKDRVTLFGHWRFRFRNRTAWHLGAEYMAIQNRYGDLYIQSETITPPRLDNYRYRGVLGYFGILQDRYATFRDIRAVGLTEDYNLGWEVSTRAGMFARSLGSAHDAAYLEGIVSRGFRLGSNSLVLWRGEFATRIHSGKLENTLSDQNISAYNQDLPFQTLAANINYRYGHNLDPENLLYLGGDNGLRGYPSYFRIGTQRWLASFEDRIITPVRILGLFQLGFVAFADAGIIQRPDQNSWSRFYANVGVGLRLGNLKSAFGRVIIVAVAFPLVREPGLDSSQIVVGRQARF